MQVPKNDKRQSKVVIGRNIVAIGVVVALLSLVIRSAAGNGWVATVAFLVVVVVLAVLVGQYARRSKR